MYLLIKSQSYETETTVCILWMAKLRPREVAGQWKSQDTPPKPHSPTLDCALWPHWMGKHSKYLLYVQSTVGMKVQIYKDVSLFSGFMLKTVNNTLTNIFSIFRKS